MEKIVLSAMVDAHGDLYFFMPNMAENFTGAFWLGKVLASKDTEVKSCTVYIDQELRRNFGGEGYYWNWNEEEKRDTALVKWHAYAPCIAQEATFSLDCSVIFTVLPSRIWNKDNGSDREGFVVSRYSKSTLGFVKSYFFRHELESNVTANQFGSLSFKHYNRSIFAAIRNSTYTNIYWLHNRKNNDILINKLTLNYARLDDNTKVNCKTCTNNEEYTDGLVALEPRITKIGNDYHFMVSNGIYPQWYKASASTGDTTWHGFNPHTYTLSTDDCCYHTDMQVMQHNGKNLALVMSLVKISHMSGAGISADSKKRWTDDKFVPWNKSCIALVISSWYEGSGYSNIDIPSDNIIEVFPVSTASNAETTSTSTLYKNTYKFVTYTDGTDNYIIYAYCYPGKTKQLYLGTCRYWFDSSGHVHLYTKREFRNKKGESFGNLTNCSRICSMDTRNGHLWITFATANNKQFCYFHAKTNDIIKLAPKNIFSYPNFCRF